MDQQKPVTMLKNEHFESCVWQASPGKLSNGTRGGREQKARGIQSRRQENGVAYGSFGVKVVQCAVCCIGGFMQYV